jgi:hypothetical protein
MRIFAIIAVASLTYWSTLTSVQAQQSDTCKECRDFQRACLQAHSKAACKIDYDICMKHCRKS